MNETIDLTDDWRQPTVHEALGALEKLIALWLDADINEAGLIKLLAWWAQYYRRPSGTPLGHLS